MPRTLLAAVISTLLVAILATTVHAQQQMADSTFRPVVERPFFVGVNPRVLLDEAHNNFHTLDGRYKPFADLLRADACSVTANGAPFTAEALAGCDLLVIANAVGDDGGSESDSTVSRSAFTAEEVEAVYRWVEGGGSLLLIADHAPFGAAASALGARFGVHMSGGYTGDSLQADGSVTNIKFTRARGTLGAHPIMDGWRHTSKVDSVVAFTGESLKGSEGSTPFMLLSEGSFDLSPEAVALRSDPEAMMAMATPAKGRSIGVALQVGKGRAVVLGEAAMLSAQVIVFPDREPRKVGMNRPGTDNQQFGLNLVRWLAGPRAK